MFLSRFFIAIIILGSSLLSGCSYVNNWVYRPDVNQGNYITSDKIEKLSEGQTKEQVLFIMGTPMLESIFDDNVWYYIAREWPSHQNVTQKTYVIQFDTKGIVTGIQSSDSVTNTK